MKSTHCFILILLLVFVTACPLLSQTDIGFKGIGGHVGLIMPEDPIDNTIGFGLQADLGKINENIALAAILDFWGKSYDAGSGFGTTAEWKFSQIIIGPMAKYYFDSSMQFQPWAGGGLGFVISKSSWEYDDPFLGKQDDSSSDTDIAFFLGGGADYKLSPNMIGYAELKYSISDADFFAIMVGVTYLLK